MNRSIQLTGVVTSATKIHIASMFCTNFTYAFRHTICIRCFYFLLKESSHPHHKHKNHAQISPIHILSIHPQFTALSPV